MKVITRSCLPMGAQTVYKMHSKKHVVYAIVFALATCTLVAGQLVTHGFQSTEAGNLKFQLEASNTSVSVPDKMVEFWSVTEIPTLSCGDAGKKDPLITVTLSSNGNKCTFYRRLKGTEYSYSLRKNFDEKETKNILTVGTLWNVQPDRSMVETLYVPVDDDDKRNIFVELDQKKKEIIKVKKERDVAHNKNVITIIQVDDETERIKKLEEELRKKKIRKEELEKLLRERNESIRKKEEALKKEKEKCDEEEKKLADKDEDLKKAKELLKKKEEELERLEEELKKKLAELRKKKKELKEKEDELARLKKARKKREQQKATRGIIWKFIRYLRTHLAKIIRLEFGRRTLVYKFYHDAFDKQIAKEKGIIYWLHISFARFMRWLLNRRRIGMDD